MLKTSEKLGVVVDGRPEGNILDRESQSGWCLNLASPRGAFGVCLLGGLDLATISLAKCRLRRLPPDNQGQMKAQFDGLGFEQDVEI